MIDSTLIERDFRRILSSRRSAADMTKTFDGLSQRINEHYSSLTDNAAKAQFRSEYRTLVQSKFPLSGGSPTHSKFRLIQLLHDHAHGLKDVEDTKEKLNRELGDF